MNCRTSSTCCNAIIRFFSQDFSRDAIRKVQLNIKANHKEYTLKRKSTICNAIISFFHQELSEYIERAIRLKKYPLQKKSTRCKAIIEQQNEQRAKSMENIPPVGRKLKVNL
jgi:hypothetical protein